MSGTSTGARSRRAYHHGDLREALVDAGVGLARERGPNGVVVREAARRVEVSHNAAYRHFADRDSLLTAIAERAMAMLTAAMERRLAAVGDEPDALALAQERLRATGRGYVDFALDQPGLFRVLFSSFPDLSTVPDPREPGAGTPLDVLVAALDDVRDAGATTPERVEVAAMLCWSTVHGFAALHVDGPLRDTLTADRDAELERVLDAVWAALTH